MEEGNSKTLLGIGDIMNATLPLLTTLALSGCGLFQKNNVDTATVDTADLVDTATEFIPDPDATSPYPKGPYPSEVVHVDNYEDLMSELAEVQPGDFAIVDVSAYWCAPCQQFKPYYAYAAQYDNGRHKWITAEDQPNMPEVSNDVWINWMNSGENNDVLMASCWTYNYYYPQIHVVQALGNEEYVAHEVYNRFYLFELVEYSQNPDAQNPNFTFTDTEGNEIIFNELRDVNEIYQVEDGQHAYD